MSDDDKVQAALEHAPDTVPSGGAVPSGDVPSGDAVPSGDVPSGDAVSSGAPGPDAPWTRRLAYGLAHPAAWLRDVCGGEAVYPLVVLFGLNAVDELDRTAFGILLPEIRDSFGIDLSAMLAIVALSAVAALALQVPIAQYADRSNRSRLALIGALVWACFSGLTGLATGLIVLTIARSGSALGKAVIDPTHNSLIADYYPIEARSRVYSTHRAANAVGAFIGPLTAGMLAYWWGWRAPFLIFVIPTIVFALMALRLREPTRGTWERRAMGASEEVVNTEEHPPSFAESWRTVHKVESLKRIWWALPFLATALVGFVTLASVLYDQEFGLSERGRGVAAACAEPFQLVGLVVGARIASRRYAGDIKGMIRFLAWVAVASSIASAGFALSPNVVVAVGFNCIISAMLAMIVPGIFAALSLAIPPRVRATGFSVASLWVIPGLVVLPLIGWVADTWNIRAGMLVMLPLFVIGSLILRTVANVIERDIAQVWRSTATRSELLYQRRSGETALVLVRGLDAGYGGRQVLHGIDMDLVEGEVVALLGTNGAGKSTLLKSISGIVEADHGAIVFDGRDITHAPPNEIAAMGISQMPGGQGVFGGLTVGENLQLAGWTRRRDKDGVRQATQEALDLFPILAQRLDDPAADLSGGQQQMLALAMSFIARPRVLLIDELSLGLAPVIVGQLLPIVERMAKDGTTVVLVEQSVNVALTVAHRAYFMERGEIRFSGPTADLLARPDLLRSVFLSGATGEAPNSGGPAPVNGDAPVPVNGDAAVPVNGDTADAGAALPQVVHDDGFDEEEVIIESAAAHLIAATTGAADGGGEGDAALAPGPPATAGATGPVLVVEGIGVAFGGIRAVDGVSFEVGRQEILGVIGPNGAGKTTIFDLISGFTPLDAGRLVLDGADVTTLGPSGRFARGLGRSFQDARLFPELTVAETLAIATERWVRNRSAVSAALHLPFTFDSEDQTRQRVGELLELMGLTQYANAFVRELSTGTRRVVDIACQVAHRPAVILLDEPSAGIAQREVEALGPVVQRLRDEMGASLVIVEHDIPFVSTVSDRLLALDQGRVIATGRPDEVLAHPDVVESYLGTSGAAIARSGTRG